MITFKKKKKKKQNKPAGFKLAKPVLLVFFGCSHITLGPSPALLHSQPALGGQPQAQLSSAQTHRFRHSPSSGLWVQAIWAFCGVHSPRCLWSQVSPSCTLPSNCLWSQAPPRCTHSQVSACGLKSN